MRLKIKTYRIQTVLRSLILGTVLLFNGCENFLEVDPPVSKIPAELIFEDEDMAESAIIGIYIDLYGTSGGFATGSNQSTVAFAGLSADELINNVNDPTYLQFENNDIVQSTITIETLWASLYKTIYQANSVLDGLEASDVLAVSVKDQLKGEALFIRAFCYFYLVNFFGDVPLAKSSNYQVNNRLPRSPVASVYDQIKADLTTAENLLSDEYRGADRTRVNKSAASALLSRVYLYTSDWARAEDKATNVIVNTKYDLVPINIVFRAQSGEAIWQLKSSDPDGTTGGFTQEGYFFGLTNGPSNHVLKEEIVSAFELGDNRMSWTTSIASPSDTIYLAYKYKRESGSSPLPPEFSMVLRLAEVYLIRAEARARQDKLSLAITDINEIRERAGLSLVPMNDPTINQDSVMSIIEHERRVELLAEWGHRWFDLKRWGRAEAVLGSKPGWSNDDMLYPIPFSEFTKNPNLKPQNQGY